MRKFIFLMLVISDQHVYGALHSVQENNLLMTKVKVAQMIAGDQKARLEVMRLTRPNQPMHPFHVEFLAKIDHKNCSELKNILARDGWPDTNSYGKEYVQSVWLLVQHCDHDVDFQKKVLSFLKKASRNDKTQRQHFAYLEDRIRVSQHLPQRYGTQGFCEGSHHWVPRPLLDEKNINTLRKEMGLGDFQEYKAITSKFCP